MHSPLKDKKIVLGITGSIAAYKSTYLVRSLIKSGAKVKVIMTSSATEFITPLTLSTLSNHPVHMNLSTDGQWTEHVELGLWGDLFLIAPLTANTMAKMAHGLADNLMLAVYLSCKCPVFFAPAMDLDMWNHVSTQDNLQRLINRNDHYIPVEHGELASGLIGDGRMAEPEQILSYLEGYFQKKNDFSNCRVVITAGPTYEKIDPVRFIGNRSTGKMGIALATELADRGAYVHLILGPTDLTPKNNNIEITKVVSAQDMKDATIKAFKKSNIAIMTAAVADFTPKTPQNQKIKKSGAFSQIELTRTTDIAKLLGSIKTERQILIGFALESNNEMENAIAKIKKKNLNFIVLNSLNDKGAGFAGDTNKVTIIHRDGRVHPYDLKLKSQVAKDISDEIAILIK